MKEKKQSHQNFNAYDIIGDIHGHARPLLNLLGKLGYRETNEIYSHPEGRKVVFLGDFIDRGPAIRKTLHIVRKMVDSGNAQAIMGNHEYNAVCYHTPDGNGDFLRSHTAKEGNYTKQHAATLKEFAGRPQEWAEWIDWFKTLPFSLDLDGLRAVHAAWDSAALKVIGDKSLQDDSFLLTSTIEGTTESNAIETILKGIEVPLPPGYFFEDKQGHRRNDIRVRWWESGASKTYRKWAFPNSEKAPEIKVDEELNVATSDYGHDEPPVFFGHYWLPNNSVMEPQASNVACLDYSVANKGGYQVAYRYNGEARLSKSGFISSN